jgi:hypothetical protein
MFGIRKINLPRHHHPENPAHPIEKSRDYWGLEIQQ